jgi:hypothetical protein
MCRAKSGKGQARRCPSHSNPDSIANRNARRRAKYAERNNTGTVAESGKPEMASPFPSAVKLMSFEDASRLVHAKEYEQYEHNPFVQRLYAEDGSSMLYIPVEKLQPAIADAVYDYDLGYRLLDSADMETIKGFCSPFRLRELNEAIESGDPSSQSYVVRNILYDKFGNIPDGIVSLMEDNKTAYLMRQRFFNYLDRDEYVIKNDDGTVAGYAFSYRGKKPIELGEMNPSVIADSSDSASFRDYMWGKNTVEDIFQADTGAYDVQIRDEYLTHVENLVKTHGIPQRGAYRMVFDAGDKVIKIPLNADGLTHNAEEAQHYAGKVNDYHKGVPIAPCQLEYNHRGMPYLVMEKVDMVQVHRYDQPEWAKSIDNFQFGRSRITGELVAYDL